MRGSPPPRPPPRPRPHPQLARSWARRRTARRVARRTLTLAVRGGPCAARWAARCRCTSLPTSLLWQLSSLPRVLRTRSMGGPLTLQVNAAHGLVEMSAPTLGQARRTHAARTRALRPRCARAAPALRPRCARSAPLRSAPLRATPAPPLPIDLPPPSARAGLCVAGGDRTLGARLPRGARHAARARNAAAAAGQRRRPLARRGAARRVSGAAHRRPRGACRAASGGTTGNFQQSCLIQALISKEEHVHCLL